MSGHRDEMIELCAAYALGTIDERDRKRLLAHLAEGCADCEAALRDFGYAATLLAASAPRVLPSPEAKEHVIAAIDAEEDREGTSVVDEKRGRVIRMPRERRSGWIGWVGWATAALLAITSGTLYESSGRLREIIKAREAEINGLAQSLAVERQWAGVLSAPGARVAEMTLTPAGQALRGRAVYDPQTRRAVIVLENATAPTDKDYELWAIRGAAPASLGVIHPDERGVAILRLENVGEPATLNAFAISLEPKGGSPIKTAPSGPVVMLGALKG